MILLEIDTESISGAKFEGYAPRSIDMDRVAGGNEAFQAVEIKPWKVHLLRRARNVQAIKTDEDALVQLGIDLDRAAFRPQLRKRLASERPDQGVM